MLGRIVSATVDFDDEVLGDYRGKDVDVSSVNDNPPTPTDETEQLFEAPDNVERVWAHYQSKVKGASRRKLDSTRRSMIRNALKVRDVEVVLRAIDGLAASPYHNGANEQRTEYLDIRYALKGNSNRGESNEARIDTMADKAGGGTGAKGTTTVAELLASVPSGAHDLVRLRMQRAREYLEQSAGSAEGEETLRQLREAPPHVEPVVAGGRVVGWARVR